MDIPIPTSSFIFLGVACFFFMVASDPKSKYVFFGSLAFIAAVILLIDPTLLHVGE